MGQSTRVFYQFANNTDMFKSRLDNFWKSHDIIYTTILYILATLKLRYVELEV